jgi:hypothetical protein
MPVQGVESPYPESTARAICEFCGARSNVSLADAALHDRTIESSEELRFVMANRATDSDHFYPCAKHAAARMPPEVQNPFCRRIRKRSVQIG